MAEAHRESLPLLKRMMSLGFSWAISLTRGRRDLSNMIIDNHTQRATTRECKPMSHHERTLLHRTRRAQGHSCYIAIIRRIPSYKASI
jgi:hypothetical protein